MKKIAFLLIAAVSLFVSCKKDDPANTTCTLSATSISGTYKMTAFILKQDAITPEVDLFPTIEACQKDDLYTFNTNGTYAVAEGATSCSPTNANTGIWSLSGTTMTIDGETSEVSDFSCTGFKSKTSDAATGAVYTLTFAKQ